MMIAFIQRLPLSAIFEGAFSILAVIFSTYRNERAVVPDELLADITLGVTVSHTQVRFFKQVLKNKFNRWRKK